MFINLRERERERNIDGEEIDCLLYAPQLESKPKT